jgi:hypothetical protein
MSPEARAAQERHLEALIAAPFWNPPYKKPNFFPRPKRQAPPPAPVSDLLTIDLEQERAARDRYYAKWQEELAKKIALVNLGNVNHTSPGNNYWLPEAKAKARWIIAANFVEMLEGARG